jgi:hypothetical protein
VLRALSRSIPVYYLCLSSFELPMTKNIGVSAHTSHQLPLPTEASPSVPTVNTLFTSIIVKPTECAQKHTRVCVCAVVASVLITPKDASMHVILHGTCATTALPLWLFVAAARRR